jgi:hypothetical protein
LCRVLLRAVSGNAVSLRRPCECFELLSCEEAVAARIAEALVLFAVDCDGLGEDLLGDLLVVAVWVLRCVRRDLRAVDRDQRREDEAGRRRARGRQRKRSASACSWR